MQKIYKVFLSLIIFSLVSVLIPFNISASNNTYVIRDIETIEVFDSLHQNSINVYGTQISDWSLYSTNSFNNYDNVAFGWYSQDDYVKFMSNPDVRFTSYVYSLNNSYYLNFGWLMPDNSTYRITNTPYIKYGTGSTQQQTGGRTNKTFDGIRYNLFFGSLNYNSLNDIPSGANISGYVMDHNPVNTENIDTFFNYTFGDGAVAPSDTPTFGQLKIGFQTDIAYSGGNQDAWRLNKDTIYFDRYDTLGNDLYGYNIELQAIPYSVESQSQQNLFSQLINDYVFDTVKVGHLGYWSPGQDKIDFTWEYVTNRFSPTWWSTYGDNWSLYGWKLSEKYYRVGWAYRARLVDDEYNTLIDWQWIYNGTSIDGQDVNEIINNNGLTPELVHSINNINNNNNTTNNNYYNNQVINYNSSDPTTDGSWIEQLISSILQTLGDLIGKILDFFSSIFDGLVDLILGLFGDINPADSFFNWFSNLFNGIGEIDLTLPEFNIPNTDLSSFNRLVQETLNIFSLNNFGFVIFIPLLLIIIKAVF